MIKYIYKSNGQYLGFLSNGNIFSRDSVYLGWIEGDNVWDEKGSFRGKFKKVNNDNYILKNDFLVDPIPRIPKVSPLAPIAPVPPVNINPIILPIGFKDGFS